MNSGENTWGDVEVNKRWIKYVKVTLVGAQVLQSHIQKRGKLGWGRRASNSKKYSGKGQSRGAEIEARSDIVGVWLSPGKTDVG